MDCTRSARPNELRSAAVTSKKTREAASVTKRGPATVERGGEPTSVQIDEASTRRAEMPIGVNGRYVPCWTVNDRYTRGASSAGGASTGKGKSVVIGRAWRSKSCPVA